MKRQNPVLFALLGPLVKLYGFLKGQRIIRKIDIKGPAIALSNHTSFYDFIYTTAAIFPHRVTYLASQKMFYDPLLGFFLRLARAIPKCLFQSDPVAIASAFRILKINGIISIFPEGQISAIGKSLKPIFSIAKFIRKAKVDVYLVKHYNAYFVNPPWTKKTFRGRIETTVDLLLTKEQLSGMTDQQIFDIIVDQMEFDASSFNREKKFRYKLNDIENLQNVLYQCPKCGFEGLVSAKDRLHCPKCHSDFLYDEFGRLGGYGLSELYAAQEKTVQNRILADPDFRIFAPVQLESYRNDRLVVVGSGELSLTRKEYRFTGLVDGVETVLTFDPKTVPYLPSDIGINVQIYEGYLIYQFVFSDRKLPTMFVHAGEFIHQLAIQ